MFTLLSDFKDTLQKKKRNKKKPITLREKISYLNNIADIITNGSVRQMFYTPHKCTYKSNIKT